MMSDMILLIPWAPFIDATYNATIVTGNTIAAMNPGLA